MEKAPETGTLLVARYILVSRFLASHLFDDGFNAVRDFSVYNDFNDAICNDEKRYASQNGRDIVPC